MISLLLQTLLKPTYFNRISTPTVSCSNKLLNNLFKCFNQIRFLFPLSLVFFSILIKPLFFKPTSPTHFLKILLLTILSLVISVLLLVILFSLLNLVLSILFISMRLITPILLSISIKLAKLITRLNFPLKVSNTTLLLTIITLLQPHLLIVLISPSIKSFFLLLHLSLLLNSTIKSLTQNLLFLPLPPDSLVSNFLYLNHYLHPTKFNCPSSVLG